MNDYKELIKKLRNAGGGCEGIKMAHDAADAIEQLVKERDEANIRAEHKCDTCKNNFKAEWRGVTE